MNYLSQRNALLVFIRTALECSVYLAPTDPGLTEAELIEVGTRANYQTGELSDALVSMGKSSFGGSGRITPEDDPMWPYFGTPRNPDYRNPKAFDFVQQELNALLRSEGKQNARLDRAVLVDRAIAANIPRLDIEAAITISIFGETLTEKNGILMSRSGMPVDPLPSAQRPVHPKPQKSEIRERVYGLVKDVIARRTDGRLPHAESLDAFPDALDRLGHGHFRLWWVQLVAELRQTNTQTTPVSALVLSAALVEAALTFVVKHARNKNLPVFRSSDFAGPSRNWRLDDLIKSAASGGDEAILDSPARARTEALTTARQRIHAGRMLADYPSGLPDLKPEEARDGKATAELVVRRVLMWLERYPLT